MMLLVIAGVLPLLVFSLGSVYIDYRQNQAQAGRQALDLARDLGFAVEDELQARVAALQVLALSPSLAAGDLITLRGYAEAVLARQAPGANILLLREDGQQLMNTALPPDAPLPIRRELENQRRLFSTRLASVSDLYFGLVVHRLTVAIEVPVLRNDGTVGLVLAMNPTFDAFDKIIRRQKLNESWLISILDRTGRRVARVPAAEQLVGLPAMPDFLRAWSAASEGVVQVTSPEGVPVLAAFSHLPNSGWTVAVAVPTAELTAPAWRSALVSLVVGFSLLFLGLTLAQLASRSIVGPISALRRLASAADSDEPEAVSTGLREVDEVAEALLTEARLRRTAIASLSDSEVRLRLVQQVGGVAYTDRTLPEPAALISGEFADIYGLPLGQTRILVAAIIALVHPDDQERIAAITPLSLQHGGKFGAEFRICRPDGEVRWISMRTEAFRGPTGLPNRIISAQQDITEIVAARELLAAQHEELKLVSQRLAQARDRAEQANRAKSRFLAGVTHELRTPLHGIFGYAELLGLEGGLNPTQTERLEAMMACGQHLLGMINAVLDMSQIESDQMKLQPAAVDLSCLIRVCLNVVRPVAEAKGLILIEAPTAPFRLFVDPTRLRQVMINLLGNAIKFTPVGTIEVRLRPTEVGTGVRVEVADTGPGIRAIHHDKLFQTFERLNAEAVSGIEGAGLGLAIAARLVQLMGGQIGYNDNPCGGSVFWLELPLPAAGCSAPIETAASLHQIALRRLRVLVADDEALNRSIAARFLSLAGHKVVCVDSGAAAVEAAAAADYDVILMDVRMPDMNGMEATRRIRDLPGPRGVVRVVAVTAQAFAEQIEMCRQAGMDSHVSKPFKQAVLLAALEDVSTTPRDLAPAAALPGAVIIDAQPECAVFDQAMFKDITESLPAGELTEHLGTLVARCETLLRELHKPSMPVDELVDDVHKLAGEAGTFGFLLLATAAREFEFVADTDASDIAGVARQLAAAVETSISIIRQELLATAGSDAVASHGQDVLAASKCIVSTN